MLKKQGLLSASSKIADINSLKALPPCLLQEVNIILHCAADIRLEVDIQSALAANYFGLQALLELAAQVINLLAFVHVSSCFVNMNQPVSSVVAEKLYPLSLGSQTVDCRQLVQVKPSWQLPTFL
jgi:hypothetical protein